MAASNTAHLIVPPPPAACTYTIPPPYVNQSLPQPGTPFILQGGADSRPGWTFEQTIHAPWIGTENSAKYLAEALQITLTDAPTPYSITQHPYGDPGLDLRLCPLRSTRDTPVFVPALHLYEIPGLSFRLNWTQVTHLQAVLMRRAAQAPQEPPGARDIDAWCGPVVHKCLRSLDYGTIAREGFAYFTDHEQGVLLTQMVRTSRIWNADYGVGPIPDPLDLEEAAEEFVTKSQQTRPVGFF